MLFGLSANFYLEALRDILVVGILGSATIWCIYHEDDEVANAKAEKVFRVIKALLLYPFRLARKRLRRYVQYHYKPDTKTAKEPISEKRVVEQKATKYF